MEMIDALKTKLRSVKAHIETEAGPILLSRALLATASGGNRDSARRSTAHFYLIAADESQARPKFAGVLRRARRRL